MSRRRQLQQHIQTLEDRRLLAADFVSLEDTRELADEAASIWRDAGISAQQIEALENIEYQVADLGGNNLGQYRPGGAGVITIDDNAGGNLWFVDQTPLVNEEFHLVGESLTASEGTLADAKIDLLTALLHEQGHALGLHGSIDTNDVMNDALQAGLRRLPMLGQADGAEAGSLNSVEYLTSNSVGNSASIDNEMPYGTVNYVIALQGVFPSSNLTDGDPLIGSVEMFAGNFAPRDYAFAHGQLLPISQNTALFSILGTTYGGDGETSFQLPDLRGRVPIGAGNGPGLSTYALGQTGGTEQVTLANGQLPSHVHTVDGSVDSDPAGAISPASVENRQPFLALTPAIALVGVFPSPDLGSDPGIGSVGWFAGNFAPRGWAKAEGQLLPISQNTALFSILGTTYGGDGENTFGLPDLRGRAAVHFGDGPGLASVALGDEGGTEQTVLTTNNLPSHNHGIPGTGESTGATGGGLAFSNEQPFLALNYNIALVGTFPSQFLDTDDDDNDDGGADDSIGVGFVSGTTVLDESDALPLIEAIVQEGIDRWASAGITTDQIAQLQATEIRLRDLASGSLATADADVITIDRDASNRGWFIDATPADDIEFGEIDPRTGELVGTADGTESHYDLLTAIMHEQGHILGLSHTELPGELMYGGLQIGGRRLPDTSMLVFEDHDDESETNYLAGGDPAIASIGIFAGNFAPRGWAATDGQLLPISQNTALFSLLGTTYGGDGISTFQLPELRGRVVVGTQTGLSVSENRLGEIGGSVDVTLSTQQLPAHTHEITLPNGKPVAMNDNGPDLVENGAGGSVDILANDTDPQGNPTAPVNGANPFSVDLDQATDGVQSTLSDSQGTWTLNTNTGFVTLVPATDFDGRASIVYTLTDTNGASDGATITFAVRAAVGDIVFNLPAGGGTAELAIDGTDIVLTRNGVEIDRAPIGTTTRLTINGTDADDDTLQIDLDGGNPIPAGGLHFNGGVGGDDGVTVINGGVVDGRYSTEGEQSGTLEVGDREVTFENLEPLDLTGQVVSDYVIDVDSTDLIGSTIVVTISATGANTLVSFDSTSNLESILFGVVNGTLSINLDTTDIDIVNVEGIGSSFAGDIVINGDVLDTINVTQEIDLGGDDLTLFGGAINVFSPITSAGGNVSLTADQIDLQNTINVGGGDVSLAPLTLGAAIDLGTQVSGDVSKIYWAVSDNAGSAIQRADVTGLNSNVETIVSRTGPTPNLASPSGIGLDPATGQVYFSDEGSGGDFIGRADLVGLNSNVQTLVDPVGIPNDVVVAGGKLYWIDANVGFDHLVRSDLDGSNQEIIVDGLDTPQGIAVDVAGGKVYWSDSNDDHIQRADINNGLNSNIEDVVTAGITFPEGISLDLVNRKIYYVASSNASDAVRRADMDGTNSNIEDIVTGLGNPNGVVVDPVGGKVYWSDESTSQINRADIDVSDGPNQNIETIVTTGTGFAKHLDLLFDPGNFTLTDTELDFITADGLTIGDAVSGDITITSEINPANITTLQLISGGVIGDTNTTTTDIAATNVILDGNVSPGASPGVLNVNGNFTLANDETYSVEIGGTAAGDTAGDHDQLAVTGTVTIGSNVTLAPIAFAGFTPTSGDTYTIIDNDGSSDAVIGTFDGLAEGAVIADFLGSGLLASISYVGGDGNDVVLTAMTIIGMPGDMYVSVGGGGVSQTNPRAGAILIADQVTGAAHLVNDPINPDGAPGLAFDSTGRLFVSDGAGFTDNELYEVDPDTGALIATIGTIRHVAGDRIFVTDLAFQPGTDVLFARVGGSNPAGFNFTTATIDPGSGIATPVGAENTFVTNGGIAFAPDGTLYATDTPTGLGLHTVDPESGAILTTVALTGAITGADGLGIRDDGGGAFTIFGTASGSTDLIVTIDPTTGVTTALSPGATGFGNPADLDFRPIAVASLTTSIDVGGNLVIDEVGGDTDDNLTISFDGTDYTITIDAPGTLGDGGIAGATGGGTDTLTIPASAFTGEILVNGMGGDDSLAIDLGLSQQVAVGYDYSVSNANFREIQAPSLPSINDPDGYTLTFGGTSVSLAPGETFTFPNPVSDFSVTGIDPALMLDPTDPLAFPLGILVADVMGALSVFQVPILGTAPFEHPIAFDGGVDGNDTLEVNNGTATNLTFDFTNASDGGLDIDGTVITYVGLEPITSTVTAANVTLNYSAASETIAVTDFGGGLTRVDSTVGELVIFNHPTNSLTINAGGGVDIINIDSLAANYPASITVDGQGDSDTINVNTNVSTNNAAVSLTAETITGGMDIVTDGGSITLTGSTGVKVGVLDSESGAGAGGAIDVTSGAISVQGQVNSNGATTGGPITFTGAGNIRGDIVGNGDVTKDGPGVLSFNGLGNSYTGETFVDAGTLLLEGQSIFDIGSSPVIHVAAGATLDAGFPAQIGLRSGQLLQGTGSVNVLVIANQGSAVHPGFSPGILSVSDVALFTGSDFNVEINGDVPGTEHSQLAALSTVVIDDANLNFTGTGAGLQAGDTIVLIDNQGANPVGDGRGGVGQFAGLPEGAAIADLLGSGLDATISYTGGDGNDVVITSRFLDFGDAPDTFGTTLASDGARHALGGPILGSLIDPDADGQPGPLADGDDIAFSDDEDGVVFGQFTAGGSGSFDLTVDPLGGNGQVDAWIDFNNDGTFAPTEKIIGSGSPFGTLDYVTRATFTATIPVPPNAFVGDVAARFRVSTAGGLGPTGFAPDGEVEDHIVTIQRRPTDFGDAPDTFGTTLASDGARHALGGPILGSLIDPDADGQPGPLADGDDLAVSDDEDGVVIGQFTAGVDSSFDLTVDPLGGNGQVDAWIDFDNNGVFDPTEKIIGSGSPFGTLDYVTRATFTATIPVPPNAFVGDVAARFRVSTAGGLGPTGFAPDGEVEDHLVHIVDPSTLTASIDVGGNLVVDEAGDDTDDNLTISFDGTDYTIMIAAPGTLGDGGIAGATGNGTGTITIPASAFTGDIIINGGGGDDHLTIDLGDGTNPLNREIVFNGEGNVSAMPGDRLTLTGGGTIDVGTFNAQTSNNGTIDLTGNQLITYTGLEPIDFTGTDINNLVLNFVAAAAETITVTDLGTNNDGNSRITSTQGELHDFAVPNTSLTITTNFMTGAGADIVNVEGLDSLFDANLTIDGDADDTVNFQTNPTTIAAGASPGNLIVDAQTINVTAAVAVPNTGFIDLDAVTSVMIDASVVAGTNINVTAPEITTGTSGTLDLNTFGLVNLDAVTSVTLGAAVGGSGTPLSVNINQAAGHPVPSTSDVDINAAVNATSNIAVTGGTIDTGTSGTLDSTTNGDVNLDAVTSVTLGAAVGGSGFMGNVNINQAAGHPVPSTSDVDINAAVTANFNITVTGDTIDFNDTVGGGASVTLSPTTLATFAAGITSTYGGTTQLTSGRTNFNGTLDTNPGGTVNVQSGATLGGTGTFDRPVEVQSGGTVAPGLSPGIQGMGNTSFGAGSVFEVEIDGVTTAGTDYDQIDVTGTVTIMSANLTLIDGFAGAGTLGDTLTLINNDGGDAINGTFATITGAIDFNGGALETGDDIIFNSENWRISYNGGSGNDLVMTFLPAAVPEIFVNDDFTVANGFNSGDVIPDADPNTGGAQLAVIGVNAFNTIQEGIDAVDTAGIVRITDDLSTDGPGFYTENLIVNKDVTVQGTENDATAVVVDGGAAGSVIDNNGAFTVTIGSITIQNGSAFEGAGIDNDGDLTVNNSVIQNNTAAVGGGIGHFSGTLIIENGTLITGNDAGNIGGGLHMVTGNVTIDDSTIDDNTAGSAGGGVFINNSTLNVQNGSSILANTATDSGGGIFNFSGTLSVDDATIMGNMASVNGGGLFLGKNAMAVSITNTSIDSNTASGSDPGLGGGGIFVDDNLSLTLDGTVTISNNMADGALGNGGGILVDTGAMLTLNGTVVTGNSANRAGGGIENNAGDVTLTNVTLGGATAADGNMAGINGGGLHVSGAGTTNVNGGTVQNNLAGQEGGGLWNGTGTMTIDGTTIDRNAANGPDDDQGGGGIFNAGGTLIVQNATQITNNGSNNSLTINSGIVSDGGTVDITGSNIAGNFAAGVVLLNAATGNVTGNTFSNNFAADLVVIGSAVNDVVSISPSTVDVNGNVTTYDGTVGTLAVDGLEGEDAFDVTASPDTMYALFGNDPTTAPGDVLVIDAGGESVSVSGQTVTVGTNQPIDFRDFEDVQLTNAGPFSLNGDATDNVLMVTGGTTVDSVRFTLDGGQTIQVQTDDFTFNGLDGNDTLDADYDANGFFTTNLNFNGNASTAAPGDVLDIDGTFDTQTLNYEAPGADGNNGNVVLRSGGNTSRITYTGLEPITAGNAADTILNLSDALVNNATLRDDAGNPGFIEIVGGTFEDTVIPNPTNSLTVNLGDMGDTLTIDALDGAFAATFEVNGGALADVVNATNLTTSLTINGGAGNDQLIGSTAADTINGGADNDTITGGLGADIQFGDAGEDTFIWNNGDGPDDNTGGADTDTFTFNGADGADDVLSLLPGTGAGDGSLVGAAFNLARTAPSTFTIEGVEIETINVNGLAGADTIDGSALPAGIFTTVTINGGDGADILTGTGGVDTINGGNDNDTITGGLGADLQFGDAGEDTFVWNNGDGPDDNTGGADTDTFTFNGADGADDVLSLLPGTGAGDGSLVGAAFNLARTAPSIFTIEGVEIENINVNGLAGSDTIDGSALPAGIFTTVTINGGVGNDLLTGTGGVDTINGGADNDTITGGLGADIQFGDAGEDLFVWNNGDGPDDNIGGADTDTFTFNGADGADDVLSLLPGTGAGDGSLVGAEFNLERFTPSAFTIEGTSIENINVNGLAGSDTIDGSALPAGIFTTVTINGGVGNDLLTGTGGVDTINGGADNDTITGGLGADLQFGDAGEDTFIWNNGDGPDDNTGGADTDTFTFNGADGADDVLTLGPGAGDGSLVGVEFNLERFSPSAFTIEGTSIENVNINGLAGEDDITVVPSSTLNITVDGGSPALLPGDTLNLDAMNSGVTISGNVSTVAGMLPITHVNIEAVNYANVTDFTIEGDNADNDVRVVNNGANTEVVIDGVTVLSHPTADMPDLTINGNGGNDTFTVDYAGGTPVPAGGLFFNGNGQNAVGGDSVVLINGTVTTVHHMFTNNNDGSIDVDGSVVTYTGLEPIIDNLNAIDRIFTFNGGNETITLGDDGTANDNVSFIDSTLGESVTFVNPTNLLTVNSGSGVDVIGVNTLDAMYAASLVIDGGDSAGDTLTMTGVDLINTPGRGLTLSELETISITGGTISGNTALIGGGLLINNSTTATTTATLSGVTVQNNTATGGTAPLDGGGGIYNQGASLIVVGASVISGNTATAGNGSGGGILSTGMLTISDSTITGNDANRAGGGIEIATGSNATTLTDVTLSLNDALAGPGNGGGLHVSGAGDVAIVRGSVINNTAASEGGGLWNAGGTMTINGTIVTGNTASGNGALNGGGGVFNESGILDIDNATISDNEADGASGSGGGILSLEGTVTIDNTTIQSNSANRAGGGIEILAGTVTITGSNLLANDVDGQGVTALNPNPGNGGGLHITGDAVVTVVGGNVNNNIAREEGGGLWNSATGTLIIDGTRIEGNIARSGNNAGNDQGGGGVFNNGGDLTIRNNVLIINNEALDNNGNGGGVMTVGGTVTIDTTTLHNNRAGRAGGGIENNDGNVTLTNVFVGGAVTGEGNTAGVNGGGLHAAGNNSVTTVTGGVFELNVAEQEGGGLWNGSGVMTILGNTVIRGNTANSSANGNNDQGGGGVFNIGGTLDIDDALITGNSAMLNRGNGGGVMTVGGTVTIDDSTIQNNMAARAGGGIENNNGNVTVTNETVGGPAMTNGNTAGVNGGGLHAGGVASITTVNGGLFQNNIAGEEGGGLWNGPGVMNINGTQILNNTANSGNNATDDQGGGGVFNVGGTLDIDSATISGNIATANNGNGGGVMTVGGTVTIDDTVIQANQATRAGGGVENNNGNVTLTGVTVGGPNVADGNTTGINGGGLHAGGGASVTVVDGGTFQNNIAGQEGGGLWNGPGMMTIRNGALITENTANSAVNGGNDQGGGGVFNIGGTLDIDDATITENLATANLGNGGGVMTVGGIVTIDNTFVGTNEAGRDGGGLHASGTSDVTVTGGTFRLNTAVQEGGGFWNGPGTLRIDGTNVTENTASSGDNAGNDQGGGGVFNIGGTLDIDDAIISNNLATANLGNGGGVMTVGGVVTIDDTTIQNNAAARAGGGIENNNGDVRLTNVTVGGPTPGDGNTAGVNGGGLHAGGGGSVTVVDGGAVQNNVAEEEGGGLWNGGGMMTVRNGVLITENTANSTNNGNDDQGGGGVFNIGGMLDIDDAIVSNNLATANNGNGGGVMTVGGTVTIDNTTIANNDAARAGGGVENNAGNVTLTSVTLGGPTPGDGNTAGVNGGGLHAGGAGSVTVVDGGTVQNNVAEEEGGGLWNGGGMMTVRNGVLITENTANSANNGNDDQGGGGVFNIGGMLDIDDAIISNNLATANSGNGGGVMTVGGTVTIDNSTIANNDAARAGGGVENNAGDVTLSNVTVGGLAAGDGNTAGINGGGLHASGDASITRTNGGLFQNNVAEQEGGGLWNGSGQMIINGTTITENIARSANNGSDDQGGGGVFNIGGSLRIDDATITNNLAIENNGNGGGVMTVGGGVVISGGTIASNQAARAGGGIENNNGNVSLTGVTLGGATPADGNTAGVNGGGLHATGASVTTIDMGTVSNNTAGQEGGGLWASSTGTMSLSGVVVSFNTANSANAANDAQGGGGIFNDGGVLAIRDNVTISDNTALDPDGTATQDDGGGGIFNNGGVVTVTGAGTSIRDNSASDGAGNGGGIMNFGGELSIEAATIAGNAATRAGGGVENNAGILTLNDAIFGGPNVADGNTAGVNGGGVHSSGQTTNHVEGGMFQNNVAGQEGGGLWNSAAGSMSITGTTIQENTANGPLADQGGGGVFNAGGVVDVSGAAITGNIAGGASGSGGGILNDAGGSLSVSGSMIMSNQANRAGGGIEVTAGTTNTLTNVNLDNNNAGVAPAVAGPGNGGGLHITGDADVTITGGSVDGNTAAAEGGGLWNGSGTLIVTNTSIDGNTANGIGTDQAGGGVFNASGVVSLLNVDLNNNTANSGAGTGGAAFNDLGTLNVRDSRIMNNSSGGLAYRTFRGIITDNDVSGNTVAGNPVGGLAVLSGTPDADLILITSTFIEINGSRLNYDGSAGAISIQSGAGNDSIEIRSTNATSPVTIDTGDGDDTIIVTSDAPGTAGTLNGISGNVTIIGGANTTTSTTGVSVFARDSAGTTQTATTSVTLGDRLIISDQSASADNTYQLTGNSFSRTGLTGLISFATIESLEITTGSGADEITVAGTNDANQVTLSTGGGDDEVTVTGTGAGSILEINGQSGQDSLTVETTGAGSILLIDSGSQADSVTINDRGASSGIAVSTGDDADTITLGSTTTPAAVTANPTSVIVINAGEGADVFEINEVFSSSVIELIGGGGNDTFTLNAAGSDAGGTLTRINDAANTRQLVIDGGTNGNAIRTFVEGVVVSAIDEQNETQVRNQDVGDTVIVNATSATAALDLRYRILAASVGVLSTGDTEVFDSFGVETVRINSGAGNDALTVDSDIAFGIASSLQAIAFDGGAGGNDELTVNGTSENDLITVGPISGDTTLEPIEVDNVEDVTVNGDQGSDQLSSRLAFQATLNSLGDNNVILGGFAIDVLNAGAGENLLFGRLGGEIVPQRGQGEVVMDVNGDQLITAVDALQVINRLNSQERNPAEGEPNAIGTRGYISHLDHADVNGDGRVSALDALMVINRLNEPQSSPEPLVTEPQSSPWAASVDSIFGDDDDDESLWDATGDLF